ncbi:hypothetical protein C1646_758395 [Rhizophagus diaphanus]|nr:hypothetical protein C1646_758395 [Rhizophagus diaphanus] [Rhizophagus sp. MUCL 43196]
MSSMVSYSPQYENDNVLDGSQKFIMLSKYEYMQNMFDYSLNSKYMRHEEDDDGNFTTNIVEWSHRNKKPRKSINDLKDATKFFKNICEVKYYDEEYTSRPLTDEEVRRNLWETFVAGIDTTYKEVYWDEPEKFNPERWFNNKKSEKSMPHVVFGGGLRYNFMVPNIYDNQLEDDMVEFVEANKTLVQEQANTFIMQSHPQAYYTSRRLMISLFIELFINYYR